MTLGEFYIPLTCYASEPCGGSHPYLVSFPFLTIPIFLIFKSKDSLLSEAICCCLQGSNIVASEVLVDDTCVSILIVIGTTINQLKTNVLLITFIA